LSRIHVHWRYAARLVEGTLQRQPCATGGPPMRSLASVVARRPRSVSVTESPPQSHQMLHFSPASSQGCKFPRPFAAIVKANPPPAVRSPDQQIIFGPGVPRRIPGSFSLDLSLVSSREAEMAPRLRARREFSPPSELGATWLPTCRLKDSESLTACPFMWCRLYGLRRSTFCRTWASPSPDR